MVKKKDEVPYAKRNLRISKLYKVDECVATKTVSEQARECRDKIATTIKDPQFYKRQRM